jgi:hypothetical protein
LQKKKMIPYEVLNSGQLRKYLNANWWGGYKDEFYNQICRK